MLRNNTSTGVLLTGLWLLLFAAGGAYATQGVRGLTVVQDPSATASLPVYQNNWAVVIGINTYKHAKIPPLRYAVNDALSVQAALEPLGFSPQHIFTLLNEAATRQGIEQTLYDRLRMVQKEDRLFVFFAGHGRTADLPRGASEGFLLPYDADPEHPFTTAISMSDVKRIGQRIAAKHILFVVDACYAGFTTTPAVAPKVVDAEYLRLVTQAPAVQVITAGTAQEQVREEHGHGVFTHQFLRGLLGFADGDWNGLLTGAELAAFLQDRVVQETEGGQNPQFGQLSGEGQFVFMLSQAGTSAGAVAAAPPEESSVTRAQSGPDPEVKMWELVKKSSHPEDITAFLQAYPNSRFTPVARLRLSQLQRRQGTTPSPTVPSPQGTPASPPGPAKTHPPAPAEQPPASNDWNIKGRVSLAAENYPKATPQAQQNSTRAIEMTNTEMQSSLPNPRAYLHRGAAFALSGKHEEAIRDFDKAAELQPNFAAAYRERGISYAELGDLFRGLHDLDEAIRLNPRDATAYIQRGIVLGKLSSFMQALQDFTTAIELHPQSAAAYRERGVIHKRVGNDQEARRDFQKADQIEGTQTR